MLPVGPLAGRYGDDEADAFRRAALRAVVAMQQEEGSHADIWRRDAQREGFPLSTARQLPSIRRLLNQVWFGTDLVRFWSTQSTNASGAFFRRLGKLSLGRFLGWPFLKWHRVCFCRKGY